MTTILKKGMTKLEMNKEIQQITKRKKVKSIEHLAGKLQADIDPLEVQKRLRNEWKIENSF
ncbi:MAG: hypothetical protein Q8S14_01465 [Algoriphagus sp.]|jgi:hypothetical protein|nr:hypothetical protein [Algoriphagus sp.]MDP2041508.1 hypothetical protein [Algoriphagus sp.]MDP3470513.1 hypothetical protein [Algoriphagus sp.]